MRRIVVVMVVLAAGARGAAADGGYGGFGMGIGAGLGGDFEAAFETDGEVAGRIVGGAREGRLAVEGVFFGTDMTAEQGGGKFSTFSLGIDFKAFAPLGSAGLEGYLRAGLGRTWLSGMGGNLDGSRGPDGFGSSWEYGFGLQYAWRTPRFGVSLWADFDHQEIRLGDDGPVQSGSIQIITFGVMFGSNI